MRALCEMMACLCLIAAFWAQWQIERCKKITRSQRNEHANAKRSKCASKPTSKQAAICIAMLSLSDGNALAAACLPRLLFIVLVFYLVLPFLLCISSAARTKMPKVTLKMFRKISLGDLLPKEHTYATTSTTMNNNNIHNNNNKHISTAKTRSNGCPRRSHYRFY